MHDAPRLLAFAAVMTTLAGCAGEEEHDPSRELYELAVAGEVYRTWPTFPNAEPDLVASALHNGDFVRSYMNDVAAGAISSFTGEFPDGSILVKEQYADAEGTILNGHTVMWKVPGFDADHGDWYWVAYNGQGETTAHNGVASYCHGCHAAARADDWVYTPFK